MSKENHPNYGLKLKDHQINRAGLIGCASVLLIANFGVEAWKKYTKEQENKPQIEVINEEVTLLDQLEMQLYMPTTTVKELQENIIFIVEEYQSTYGKISGYEGLGISTLLQGIERHKKQGTSLEEIKAYVNEWINNTKILEGELFGNQEEVKRKIGLIKTEE